MSMYDQCREYVNRRKPDIEIIPPPYERMQECICHRAPEPIREQKWSVGMWLPSKIANKML